MRLFWILASIVVAACSQKPETSDLSATRKKSTLCLGSCPSVSSGNRLIEREIYSLSNNPKTKFADWVAYKVIEENIGDGKEASRNWQADPLLSDSETLETDDYVGASEELSVDRGHQVPLASFTGSPYWAKTNYLSNITPQRAELNQGPWKKIEDIERQLAKKSSKPTWVITGPVFEHYFAELPEADEKHRIPSGYWKIIAIEDNSDTIAGAFYRICRLVLQP